MRVLLKIIEVSLMALGGAAALLFFGGWLPGMAGESLVGFLGALAGYLIFRFGRAGVRRGR